MFLLTYLILEKLQMERYQTIGFSELPHAVIFAEQTASNFK